MSWLKFGKESILADTIYVGETYTKTIKFCPLDVDVCQLQMYERISFKLSHYQLWSLKTFYTYKKFIC